MQIPVLVMMRNVVTLTILQKGYAVRQYDRHKIAVTYLTVRFGICM